LKRAPERKVSEGARLLHLLEPALDAAVAVVGDEGLVGEDGRGRHQGEELLIARVPNLALLRCVIAKFIATCGTREWCHSQVYLASRDVVGLPQCGDVTRSTHAPMYPIRLKEQWDHD
jgi:hypothetical protein